MRPRERRKAAASRTADARVPGDTASQAAVDPNQLNVLVKMEILKLLRTMKSGDALDGGEDVPAGYLDGLRISRNLSRMRQFGMQIEAEPLRT